LNFKIESNRTTISVKDLCDYIEENFDYLKYIFKLFIDILEIHPKRFGELRVLILFIKIVTLLLNSRK